MGSVITATEYKEPSERISAMGFASSILNGNTVEGGLRSLTYKSIFALELVDEADLVKQCIVSGEPQLTRICETDLASDRVEKLRAEIQALQNAQRSTAVDQQIDHFSSRLEQELEAKSVSSAYSSDVKKFYQELFPDMAIRYGGSGYVVHTVACPVKVDRMEDAVGFDRSIYERAHERKLEEERLKQQELQKERERKIIQEQAKEQAAKEQAEQAEQAERERLQTERQQPQEMQQEMQEMQRQQNYPAYGQSNGVPVVGNVLGGQLYNDAMHLDADTPMAPAAESYSVTPAADYTPGYTPGYTPSGFSDYPQETPYQGQSPY